MKRKVEELKLDESPLVLVLGQVRIAPILEMEKYVPPIQESLRKMGYPRYRAAETQEIIFGPQPKAHSSKKWTFLDKEGKNAVVLSTGFVVLETCHYETFEDFTLRYRGMLEVIGKTAEIVLTERLGLRYVNLMRPQAQGKQFGQYLKPGLLGLSNPELKLSNIQQGYNFRATTDMGMLVVRLLRSKTGQILPPDLAETELNHGVTLPKDEECGILDIDHFSEAERDYELDSLVSEFWRLHGEVELAFRSAVTEEALKDWKARPLGVKPIKERKT